ncbi:MAG TPA: cysteine-rich CWC family protein [Albitalea sp.]|nr:cysteine-rich CWC family protein [Albitalea sp.]
MSMDSTPKRPPPAATLQALPNAACPLCGGPNACSPAATGSLDVACWCNDAVIDPAALARVPPALRRQACLCPACAGVALASPRE